MKALRPSPPRILVALGLLVLAPGEPAAALDTPSATGIALRTPGVLLSDAALQFVFPQAAGRRVTGDHHLELEYSPFRQVGAGTAPIAIGHGVSGVVLAGSGRFFVQHRTETSAAVTTAKHGVVEVGAALAGREWSLGISAAGGPSNVSLSSVSWRVPDDGNNPRQISVDIRDFRTRGASLGVGWRRGLRSVDAVVRFARESDALTDVRMSAYSGTDIAREANLESQRFSAALRAAFPVGDRSRITAYGEWRDLPVDLERSRQADGEPDVSVSGTTKGHSMRLAVLVSRGVPGQPGWGAQADWQRTRSGSRGFGSYEDLDQLELGVSHWRPLPYGLELLAGWSVLGWTGQNRDDFGAGVPVSARTTEQLTDGFSWGVRGRWQRLEVSGVVTGNLALFQGWNAPFLALDARLEL